jgi:hypothetical protein
MDMADEQAKIGRWLGSAHRIGSDMTYWVLTEPGKVIACSTVQHVTSTDMSADAMKTRMLAFDTNLLTRLDDEDFQLDLPNHYFFLQNEDGAPNEHPSSDIPTDAEYGDMMQQPKTDADDIEFNTFDQYLGAEFLVNSNVKTAMATATKRAKDNEGNPIGKRNVNPLLDTREYKCTMEDGAVYRYNANIIADNIYSQCDDEGRRHAVLQEIIEHKKDRTAVDVTRGHTITKRGRKIPKTTTKGWKLLCQWRDGSSGWVDLKHVKDSNPIQIAEYAVANRLQEEPAFKWWVAETLRTRNRIIAKVKSRYWKTSHKYGVKLPHLVTEALQIDKETGANFWWKAIQKSKRLWLHLSLTKALPRSRYDRTKRRMWPSKKSLAI